MATIADLASQHNVTDRMVRNYLALVAKAHPSEALKVTGSRTELTDFAVEQIAALRSIGPAAYSRQHAPEPIAPVAPEPQTTQPEPQPEPVAPAPVVSEPQAQTTQDQPTAITFQVVEIDPGSQLATAPVHRGLSNLIPFAPITQAAQANIQSTQSAIAAVRFMAQGMRSRLEVGTDVSWQQRQLLTDELATLDLEIEELEVAGQLHRQQQLRTQAIQNLAGSEVGKRIARLEQLAAANGYQLQPQSC